MLPHQWNTFKRAARLEKLERIPMALIVDSPWIPGYLGLSHMDYYLDPEIWFQANLRIMREFPDVIFVPSWWMEYGMAAEPSILGVKIKLQRILDHGYILPMVAARGPLCTAGFVRGTAQFMMDLIEDLPGAHRVLDLCTRVVIDWLQAQRKAMGDTVEGFLLLDDIVGFINERFYMEFAHPYLKRICDAFPEDWVKVYHNDAKITACLDHLPDAGFHVLNWGRKTDIREVKRRVGNRMCLMGNANPLEIGVRGTPEEVRAATLDVLEGSGGDGIILSVGGGVSPRMPRENILAMRGALDEFYSARTERTNA